MKKQGFIALFAVTSLAGCGESDESTERKTFSIQSQKVICEGVSQQLCLSVSGQNDLTAFFPFYENIDGFTYQWGHSYALTVEVSKIENPPADRSEKRYTLVSVSSDYTDNSGTQYSYSEVELKQNTFTKNSQGYVFLGQPFTCTQTYECDILVSMSGSGGILDVLIFSYIGDGKIQLESWL